MAETLLSIPGYAILEELGRGGMGVVYKAKDLRNDRLVAVKLILSGRGATAIELARFRIEAEAIGSLEHPHIVESRDIGVHLGYPFVVLEYAENGSLAGRIRSQGMPCDWIAQMTLKLALAMQHVHERGILHRDLKPSNVLMMADDIPKITDFGLAKFTPQYDAEMMTIAIPADFADLTKRVKRDSTHSDKGIGGDLTTSFDDDTLLSEWEKRIGTPSIEDEQRLDAIREFIQEALRQASLDWSAESQVLAKLTQSRAIMGTPQYMSPEQASGRITEVGPAADVYSLGAVMYEMLTGQPPFTGPMMQVIAEVITRPPVPPRQRRDSIAPGLEAICMKCLAKKTERRYESMAQLAEDLRRFMSCAAVEALNEASPEERQSPDNKEVQGSLLTNPFTRSTTLQTGATRTKSWWRFWR